MNIPHLRHVDVSLVQQSLEIHVVGLSSGPLRDLDTAADQSKLWRQSSRQKVVQVSAVDVAGRNENKIGTLSNRRC